MPDFTEAAKDTVKKTAKTAKFEAPKFEAPAVQFPEAFREMAEKGVEQAKEGYARIRTAAEDATDMVEDTYLSATRGAAEFNLKAIETLRANVNCLQQSRSPRRWSFPRPICASSSRPSPRRRRSSPRSPRRSRPKPPSRSS
jgi:hypothetical protein